ncbi:MAG: hypothetical protein DDT21_00639 [Syntrophomonadaceae bacterium]|nr:hypothetical protein [Bacillota bacterium]
MSSPVAIQAWLLVLTVLAGILIGLFFDVYRVAGKFLRPSRRVLFFGDLLFWLLAAVFVFLILLIGNRGEVRVYIFIGLSTGWLLYVLLFSRNCYRLMVAFASVFISLLHSAASPLCRLSDSFCAVLSKYYSQKILAAAAHGKMRAKYLKDKFRNKQE